MNAVLEKTYRLRGFGCCFSGAALRAGTRVLRNSSDGNQPVCITDEKPVSTDYRKLRRTTGLNLFLRKRLCEPSTRDIAAARVYILWSPNMLSTDPSFKCLA